MRISSIIWGTYTYRILQNRSERLLENVSTSLGKDEDEEIKRRDREEAPPRKARSEFASYALVLVDSRQRPAEPTLSARSALLRKQNRPDLEEGWELCTDQHVAKCAAIYLNAS